MDTIYEISDLEPLVHAGAKYLDEHGPAGWYNWFTDEVWKNFNAHDAYHDVLGTLFGSYQAGLEALGFSDAEDQYAEAEKLGFDISDEFRNSYFDGSDAWIDLACLWHEVIVDRQENGVPQ